MIKTEFTSQKTNTTISNSEAAPAYLQPYVGFLESNPRIRTAAEAIDMYSTQVELSDKEKERLLQGYIWQEDPKNIKQVAGLTWSSPSMIQTTLFKFLNTHQDHFRAIDTIITRSGNANSESPHRQEKKTRLQNLKDDIQNRVEKELNGRTKEIALLSLSGKSIFEISSMTGLALQTVTFYLHQARKAVEKTEIYDEGFVRLRAYNINTAQVRKGNLDAVEIFNIHYILSEDGELYKEEHGQSVDKSLLEEGFSLAKDKLSLKQYNTLRMRHKDLYTKHRGRIYITADNLQIFFLRYTDTKS